MRRAIRFSSALLLAASLLCAQEPTLEDVLQKNLEAVGGADAVGQVQTLKVVSKMLVGGMAEVPMTTIVKRPNMVRTDMLVQGQSVVSAYDGATGWLINPMLGSNEPQKMDEKTASTLASSDMAASLGALQAMKDAGATLELAGKEDLDGVAMYKIRVVRKSGQATTYFLNASTYLPAKLIMRVSQMGQEMDIESFPGNYKKVGSINFPYSIENKLQGRSMMQITVENVTVNEPAEDSIFKMPEAKPTEEKKPQP